MNVYGRYALDVFKRFLLKDGTEEEKFIEIKIELNSISGFNLYPLSFVGKTPFKVNSDNVIHFFSGKNRK